MPQSPFTLSDRRDGRPLVGVTGDHVNGRTTCPDTYIYAIEVAGGLPIVLPNAPALSGAYAEICSALVLTGGDDPDMTEFGEATHPAATVVAPERQAFETALLREFNRSHPEKPVLGVCLGMQWMGLLAGGRLDQHMPDTLGTHADHADDRPHTIEPTAAQSWISRGVVTSKHHQAISDPGSLSVVAVAHDGVIEAIDDPRRPYYRGVQWHPERTEDSFLGLDLYLALIESARG